MNLRLLLLAIFYTVVLAASVPVRTHYFYLADAAQIEQQTQETTISLKADALRHPHFLTINPSTKGTQLTGDITLDGKLLQRLNNSTTINLAPRLTRGKHAIKISGKYYPIRDSIQIEFIGPNTQVNQETGGSGYLNQTLIIEVK
jgi:uncharacterized protein YxjI